MELEELLIRTRAAAAGLHGRGTLWLTRLLPPIVADDADWVVWTTTPYLLQGPGHEAQWLAYCELARKHRTLRSKKRNGLLAPRVAPLLETIFAAAPAPQLANNDGDEIVLATATYDVVDAGRARQALAARFEGGEDGVYHLSVGDVLVARLDVSGRALRAECNSKERLARTKQLLSELLGDAVKHRADAYQDPRVAMREAKNRRAAVQPSSKQSLPPEAQTQIQAMMLERMRSGWTSRCRCWAARRHGRPHAVSAAATTLRTC